MILTCPACATRYLTDPALLGPAGRTVRCAKCGHSWMQAPPADMPQRIDVPIPPKMDASGGRGGLPARLSERRSRRLGAGFALGVLALVAAVLVVLAGGAYLWREWIVAQLPQTKAIYDQIGVRAIPLGTGLELSNLTFERRQTDGGTVIAIEGQVFNSTAEAQTVPTLKATLQDEKGRWLRDWTFTLGQATLESGETAIFQTTTRDPPPATQRLSVTFTDELPES